MKLISSLRQGYWYFIASSTDLLDVPPRYTVTTHTPNQPLLHSKKENWAMQICGSQVEEKPILLHCLCKVSVYMLVSGVTLFMRLPISRSIFNSQSLIQLCLKSVATSHHRDYISLSFRGEAKHSSSIKLAPSPHSKDWRAWGKGIMGRVICSCSPLLARKIMVFVTRKLKQNETQNGSHWLLFY